MAATEGFGARTGSRLIGRLAVPRVVTFPILIAFGLGLSQLAWHYVDSVKILAWASGMSSPFCMLCATAVWAMRDRIDDAVDTELMSSSEYRRFDEIVRKHRAKSTFWAAITAVMAMLASGPAVSNQLIGPIWHGMVLLSGAAIGVAIYAYLLANYWENQIQGYKSQRRLSDKQRRERNQLLEDISANAGTLKGSGWIDGPTLSQPTPHQH